MHWYFSCHPHANLMKQRAFLTLAAMSEPGLTHASCGGGLSCEVLSWVFREAVKTGWLLTEHTPAAKASRFCMSFCFQRPCPALAFPAQGRRVGELLCFPSWLLGCRKSQSRSVVYNSLWLHGLYSPWNSPGHNTGVGSLSLLQEIFLTQELNPGLPHCRRILDKLNNKASPSTLEQVAFPFSRGSSQSRKGTKVSCIAGGFLSNWAISEAPWL